MTDEPTELDAKAEVLELRAAIEASAREVEAYFKELDGESARAAVILAVAELDDELAALVRSKFPSDIPKGLRKKLFGAGLTPFGAFQSKVDVAQAFGFFDEPTGRTLEKISRVRNRFAHSGRAIDFHHADVLAACEGLGLFQRGSGDSKPGVAELRTIFIRKVQDVTEALRRVRFPELYAPVPSPDKSP